MNKEELKKILKPLIKECIKEVLFDEEGTLSHIIVEVTNGLSTTSKPPLVKESVEEKWISRAKAASSTSNKQALLKRKKKLLDSIGNEAYNGVNLFEGTTPTQPASAGHQGALSGISDNDPGVNISSLVTGKSSAIFKRMMEKK